MVSGHSGQAGLAARSHAVKELDVELDAAITQFQPTTADRVSAKTLRPRHALYETAQVKQHLCPLFQNDDIIS